MECSSKILCLINKQKKLMDKTISFFLYIVDKENMSTESENENLRSEVKDYKLLRKVFGHKQIDELLEQARNVKGQKRENSRSR